MTDYLAGRQTAGLGTDHAELNAKLDALARYFDLDWLKAEGANPLQILWKSRDALATNELLNFGDAVKNFERVDSGWLEGQVPSLFVKHFTVPLATAALPILKTEQSARLIRRPDEAQLKRTPARARVNE